MKAAVVRELNAPVTIEEVETDRPGPHEVVVRTAAAGVCHSDLSGINGKIAYPVPFVLGHESAGVVEEVGTLVTYVVPGDHVVTCLSAFCGHCEFCLSGRPQLCERAGLTRAVDEPPRLSRDGERLDQFTGLASFAERMLVHENAVVKIPRAMPLDRAALLGCGTTTGLGAVFNTARVAPGESVAVVGCGGVGLSAIQGARIAGALTIVAVDPVAARRELARELGATDVVDPADGEAWRAVMSLTGGGVDHAFECVGTKGTAEQAFRMLRRGGTTTLVGVLFGETLELEGRLFFAERRIQGCSMGSNRFRIDIPRYTELYLQGRLRLDELITSRIGLDGLNDAFDAMRRGEGARTVVVF
jgi:S-(hydroxymethyl)glutathione dehydrogenase/alcohol dehydrogenase